ncbi:MAG: hypothetical protein ACI4TK_20145, partial [Agathobacter sp.]
PNDTLKWLKNSRFYGSIDGVFDVSFSMLQPRKEAQMGKLEVTTSVRTLKRFWQICWRKPLMQNC